MTVFAIDPGYVRSAWVLYDGAEVVAHGIAPNAEVLAYVHQLRALAYDTLPPVDRVVIEQIESFGMAVGREVFETVFAAGRFAEAAEQRGIAWDRLPRKAVKLHLCQSMRAKDANIRQALIDRFGGSTAIGKKHTPGPLYGIRADEWAALAVAVTWHDTHATQESTNPC